MRRFLVTLLVISLAVVGVLICISVARTIFSMNKESTQPDLNLDRAADNLEVRNYTVSYIDDEDELAVGVEERLYAKTEPQINADNFENEEEYLNYLETYIPEWIEIVVFENTKTAKLYYKSLKLERDCELKALKLKLKEYRHILDEYSKDLDDDEEEYYNNYISDLNKQIGKWENYVIGRKGNTVWCGTKQAMQDSHK